jgi:hypothetical protein
MDLIVLILVLILYFLRPQEWGGVFSGMHPIQLVSVLVIIAILRKEGGFKLKSLFQTPHHWIVFLYFGWTIFASETHWETFKNIQGNILFYILAVQALTTIPRLKTFMAWWAWLIMGVATLALLSQVGFDPLGSHERTEWMMKGRLVLNLSIFNNPNGLAHSIVPVIPMLYFLLFWKRIVMKPLIAVMFIPLLCIFLTLSKGAFLCGFATVAATLTFGRPKAVQVLIMTLALTVGITALYALPRMGELSKSKSDPAIQGRIAAAKFGLECLEHKWYGNGWGNFRKCFFRDGPMEKKVVHIIDGNRDIHKIVLVHYEKAAHGTYNQNGADLGYPGLFLFVGILYCCFRTLITAKTRDVEEERIRRMLFAIVVSYAVSAWMVDFFYRTILFLFAAATAALHIILSKPKDTVPEENPISEQPIPVLPWRERQGGAFPPVLGVGQPVVATSSVATVNLQQMIPAEPIPAGAAGAVTIRPLEPEGPTAATMKWKRYGVVDFFLNWGLTWLVIQFWKHIISSM